MVCQFQPAAGNAPDSGHYHGVVTLFPLLGLVEKQDAVYTSILRDATVLSSIILQTSGAWLTLMRHLVDPPQAPGID